MNVSIFMFIYLYIYIYIFYFHFLKASIIRKQNNSSAPNTKTFKRVRITTENSMNFLKTSTKPAQLQKTRRRALPPLLLTRSGSMSTRRNFRLSLSSTASARLTVRSAAKRAAMNLFDWNRRADDAEELAPRASRFVVLLTNKSNEKENSICAKQATTFSGVRWCAAEAELSSGGDDAETTLFG